jgi:ATP-dependent DNA ligase
VPGVRLFTRAGTDFSSRFPFITMAVSKLPISSCLIDGGAIVCDENGLAVFDLALFTRRRIEACESLLAYEAPPEVVERARATGVSVRRQRAIS